MSSYLTFITRQHTPKTVEVAVMSTRHGDMLGVIRWYGVWRAYVLEPTAGTVWSDGCLEDVRVKLASLNAEQRAAVAARRAS